MLVRAVELGVDVDGIDELRRLFSYDGSPEFIHRYIRWNDSKFMETFTDEKYAGKYCFNLLSRLRQGVSPSSLVRPRGEGVRSEHSSGR